MLKSITATACDKLQVKIQDTLLSSKGVYLQQCHQKKYQSNDKLNGIELNQNE